VSRAGRLAAVLLLAAAAAAPPAALAQGEVSAGDGTLYIGTYANAIYEIDEASAAVTGRIPLQTGIPRSMVMSADRSRFYVLDISYENIEVVDIAGRRTLDRFTLSTPGQKVRIWGYNIDPRERYAILLVKRYRQQPDRYEVGPPTLLRYDLRTKSVTDTIAWPQGEEREGARILFSPDGDLLYFFADEILVFETERFTEVGRWDYAAALDDGMGDLSFGFPEQPYEESGYYTGLFRVRDPVQNRQLMGVARVHLNDRRLDYFALGPSASVSFALAPGGRRAYGLVQEVGNYQFWTFDLESRRVESRARFAGRPRMSLMTSSNGRVLYVYNAGNTIDLYDADGYRHLRTIEMDADNTTQLFVVPGPRGRAATAPGER
jgi:hypothetical protein